MTDLLEPAIRRAIKAVGVGKKGSKSLEQALIDELIQDFRENRVSAIAKGAFLGALMIKGINEQEMQLENALAPGIFKDAQRLMDFIAPEVPTVIKQIGIQFLKGQTIDQSNALALGRFLFSSVPGDGMRGLAASVLRVRYETPEEYSGLLSSMEETVSADFRGTVPAGDPVIQLAEPFDGVDQSYLITPLLADCIQQHGYRVMNLVGRNSGPKFGNTLLDLAQSSDSRFIKKTSDCDNNKPQGGWYLHQADLSSLIDRWVEIRREIIKRPFLSTLEKFLNPFQAQMMITSAFHPPYTEKMITIAQRAGFPGAIVVRNGLEGSLAFALKRPVKIMCSARQKDGTYLRHEFEIDAEKYLGVTIPIEEKLTNPSLSDNRRLIETFRKAGKTDYDLFDWRVQVSSAGLIQAIDWVKGHGGGQES